MKIHCLIENSFSHPNLVSEHGLSLLIEACGKRILFDTGASPAFAENAAKMGIDINTVDAAVISHGHYDHGGGLARFLELNQHACVWVSRQAFEPHFNASGKDIGLNPDLARHPRILPVQDSVFSPAPGYTLIQASEIPCTYPAEGAGMSAEICGCRVADDFRHEQYLLIEENERRVLISGCSHRGILNIATHIRVDVLIGGFHLMKADVAAEETRLNRLAEILMNQPTVYYTGHCTGDAAFAFLKSRMKEQLHGISTGQLLEI